MLPQYGVDEILPNRRLEVEITNQAREKAKQAVETAKGQGDSARSAVDRLLAATAPTDSLYPEILYTQAMVANTAADMRRHLQRVVVEHPTSAWVDDALIRRRKDEFRAYHALTPPRVLTSDGEAVTAPVVVDGGATLRRVSLHVLKNTGVVGCGGVREALPEIEGQGFFDWADQAYATGEPYVGRGVPAKLQRRPGAPLEERFVTFVFQPIRDPEGRVTGLFVQGSDVTEVAGHASASRWVACGAMRSG